MKFDVLDRNLELNHHFLLEASAGTGKTFSIENIVVRLLLCSSPLLLEEMLVVTFTRAATRDLKKRIRSAILKALDILEHSETFTAPDYLNGIIEQGLDAVTEAKQRLENALFGFDEAQIYTIHSFCHRMLHDHVFEGGVRLDISEEEGSIPPSKIKQIIRDFLRTQLDPHWFGKEAMRILLKAHKGDFELLLNAIMVQLEKGLDIVCEITPENRETPDALFSRLVQDCQKHYRKYLEEEELYGYDAILHAMRRSVALPGFAACVRGRYRAAIIDEFQDTDPLQWDIFKTLFLANEEFKGHLYLVGDPKQSIYAFRRADVYTYLAAAHAIGMDKTATLDTNYRSQPDLVHALNVIFTEAADWMPLPRTQSSLPFHPVQSSAKTPVKSFNDALGCMHFFIAKSEGKYALKSSEESYFFPFIVQEIQRLQRLDHLALNKCAVLVKDRHQAERLMHYLNQWGIPTLNQKQELLGKSSVVSTLRDLIEGVLDPRHISNVKIALGGSLLGWTYENIQKLEEQELREAILGCFYAWRTALIEEGFAPFFLQFLQTRLPLGKGMLSESLLSRKGGVTLYHDLLQLAELLAEVPADALINHLDALLDTTQFAESGIKRRPETDAAAVQVLTMHASKGLEFDVVFALGLAARGQEPELLITIQDENTQFLQHVDSSDDPRYQCYVAEMEAEKMRQLYVVMTRAKHRLYVPVIECADAYVPKIGTASPLELFFARIGDRLDTLCQRASITYCYLNGTSFVLDLNGRQETAQLIAPPVVNISVQPLYIHSFTTLSKGKAHAPISEQAAPHDVSLAAKTPHTLPAGSEIGNLLHQILEVVPFEKVATPQALLPVITPFLRGREYQGWDETIASILFQALHTPLPLKTGETALVDLEGYPIYRETEFLYPWDQHSLWPEFEVLPGFLKGVIDLVFEHKGYYYLLDWKSNWLGPNAADYHEANMRLEMEKHHYFLQAQIYEEALRRYLKIVDPRPFEQIFGGTFYVFLRGPGIYRI